MGKPTGFMEYQRELPTDFLPEERILHWKEFHRPFPEEKLQIQASRCMDCGTPFCHTGRIFNGSAAGCPIHNLIPEWNDLIYHGLWQQALERLNKTNNFPEFTGRVCPAPCEGSCTLGISNPPVTIKNNELAIIEKGFAEGWMVPEPPARRTGQKVAVVGSGPSGLACADLLNRAGHSVTVFERADRVGGLLMYGIPNMKLDKSILKRRVDLMSAEGIEFVTRTEVGRNLPAEKLLIDFDAAVLCCGATKPRDLPVEGRQLKGVHFAMEFLTGNTRNLLGSTLEDDGMTVISARGKDVIVIGGGDTGTDCVGTALRHGCRSVTQFEILDKPSPVRQADNPWPEWPRVLKVDYGQEESMAVSGEDPRIFNVQTKRIVGDDNGRVKEIHTIQVEWVTGANGRKEPREIPGTEKVFPAQLVLIAMGFLGPEDQLIEKLAIARDARTNVQAEYGRYTTSVPGIFAAGDMRRGQSLVVWAIHEGRGAAREVDRFLMGETELKG
ncbi:glutamate synthase subunit beta [Leptolinea tardivitalis]|uniref:Glutamate synthase n=1 Tax=Leptolinea tardivitalis TaxID=229920 RepID=A0A0P6X8I4_9CHLR|nr:glutamate synthase subunit beta [Leptolinea tardivitalis]KPL70547.1 glutamate synthase [Leptolinea tardivitalis]GAP22153.1 glutamate synthase, NADH/NADPH, small subunit [Leptolinea tardivitalis]